MWKELVPEQNSGTQFSVYVAHPNEISVAKFRLTSALGRQSQRPGLAAQAMQLCRGLWPEGCQHRQDHQAYEEASSRQALGCQEPAAVHAVEGAGCSISLQLKMDESETAPRTVLCTSLYWGLLKRVGRRRMADGLCCQKVKDV